MSAALFNLLEHPEFPESGCWHRQVFDENQPVFEEGDHGREVFLILAGKVRILGNVDLDDQRKIQPGFSELEKGHVFGELAAFDQAPRSATVVTLEETTLAVIDGDKLIQFLDEHPEIGYPIFKELIDTLVSRLRKANKRIFSLFAWGLKAKDIDKHI